MIALDLYVDSAISLNLITLSKELAFWSLVIYENV